MNEFITAFILGIVEGTTEFLPISSTGHLIIATQLLNKNQESLASFNIIIQLGAILAVLFLYKEQFVRLLNFKSLEPIKLDQFNHPRHLNLIHIALSIFPVLAIGFLLRKWIKLHLYNPQTVTASLIVVGIIMLIIEKIKPKSEIHSIDHLSYQDALLIGIAQITALIPGVSRSGATMLMAMMRKIDVKISADFSFLISVPVIGLATLYELLKSYQDFNSDMLFSLLIGLFTSFVVAIIAIKTFLRILKKLSLTPFAIYRILFGLAYYLVVIRAS